MSSCSAIDTEEQARLIIENKQKMQSSGLADSTVYEIYKKIVKKCTETCITVLFGTTLEHIRGYLTTFSFMCEQKYAKQ